MWKDPRLKKICDIEADEPPYGIAVLTRFRTKVGPERLSKVVDQAVELLVKKGRIKGESIALDSTFIKAYSRRNLDNRTCYSDPESRIGRGLTAKGLISREKPATNNLGRPKFAYCIPYRTVKQVNTALEDPKVGLVTKGFSHLRHICRFEKGGYCKETRKDCAPQICPQIENRTFDHFTPIKGQGSTRANWSALLARATVLLHVH
jgi:hypothetical protein